MLNNGNLRVDLARGLDGGQSASSARPPISGCRRARSPAFRTATASCRERFAVRRHGAAAAAPNLGRLPGLLPCPRLGARHHISAMTAQNPSTAPRHRSQSLLRDLDRRVRGAAVRADRAGALHAGVRARLRRARRRDRGDRGAGRRADLRQHHRGAGAQRQAARPGRRRVLQCSPAPHTNDALLAIEREIAPKLAAHSNRILQNEALFQRIDALHRARDALGLTAEQRRVLDRYHMHVQARRRRPRRRRQGAARRDHRAARDARHELQPERARRRAGLHADARDRGGPRRPAGFRARGGARGGRASAA